MKKQLLLILLLVLQSFAIFVPVNNVHATENPEGYTIERDMVYWENDWARLEVYPHTSYNILTHVQYANLTWKLADNDIDVAFRFDSAISNGKIWKKSGNDWIPVSMYLTEYGGKYYYRHDNFYVVQDGFYQFKWQYSLPVNTSGKWELLGKLSSDTIQEAYSSGRYVMLDPWWNSSWLYYRTLTINPAYIDTNLSNFPVLVNVSAAISAKCDLGNSIRFLNTDNTTEYYYEIEDAWNAASYNFVWVNITQVNSSSDTRFLMYYGNTGATDNQSPTNVWNSGYKLVSHLNTSDSTTLIVDSTTNRNNGTKLANAEPAQATGNIGYGQNYDGDDDNISYSNIGDTFWGFSVWIKPATIINKDSAIKQFININNNKVLLYGLFGPSTGLLTDETFCFLKSSGGDTRVGITEDITASWHLLSASWDDNEFQIYLDGVNLTEITSGATPQQTITDLILGNFSTSVVVQDMDVDEFRVSIVKRNDSWMKAIFNSENQTTGFLAYGLERTQENITTNTTTGIELTNATARGFINDIAFSGNYNYGFWIGRTIPVTGDNADQNVTGASTVTAGSNFSYNIMSLSKGTHYYVRAWATNATFFGIGNEDSFWTKCDVPSGFTVTASGCNVALAWTKGTGAVRTTVVRKVDTYPTSQTDGTVIYNNTASFYSDITGGGSHQYYRAWSWAGDKHSDANASANVIVPPCPPTSVAGSLLANGSLNISWIVGTGAATTLVVRKTDSSPTAVTDGTVMYNNTGTYYVATDLTGNYYFRLWSYANETYSTSAALDYGALIVNCYNEETNDSLYFDVFVSNQTGSQTYESKNNTNPHRVNVTDLPIDDKVSIRVSAASNYSVKTETFTGYSVIENATVTYVVLLQEPKSKALTNVTCRNTTASTNSYPAFTLVNDVITILADAADQFNQITVNYTHYEYESRTYYRDLTTNHIFVLNAYLPSTDDKILCRITVINELSQSVDDAYVEIQRNINSGWTTIASRYTDGNGQVDVFLVGGVLYKFVISKTNYVTEYADWTPSTEVPIHTFKLYFEEVEPIPPFVEPEKITFNGYISGTILYVNYSDDLEETIDTQIFVYEINITTGIETLFGSDSKTTNNSFQVSFTNINTSNTYKVILHYNHTTFGFNLTKTLIFEGTYTTTTTPGKITELLDAIVGSSIFGWGNFLIWLFLVAGCYYADQRDAGKILVLLGGLFLFLNVVIGFNTTLITIAGGAIPVLFIVVGIIVMWNDSRKVTI